MNKCSECELYNFIDAEIMHIKGMMDEGVELDTEVFLHGKLSAYRRIIVAIIDFSKKQEDEK